MARTWHPWPGNAHSKTHPDLELVSVCAYSIGSGRVIMLSAHVLAYATTC